MIKGTDMQDPYPYEEYFRCVRRRHRAQVAIVVGTILLLVAATSAVVVAWQVSAENQRIAAAFTPTPR
jgi:hypothetical protein